MNRTKINQLENQQTALIKGWVHEVRTQSKIQFLVIRDNSGLIQAIITQDLLDQSRDLQKEAVVELEGKVKEANISNEEITRKDIELEVTKINILSQPIKELPIQIPKGKDNADLSTRLNFRWLDLRKPQHTYIFKLWTAMEQYMREWWKQNEFIQIYSPKFMGTASESGAELFEVEYFGKKAYLAQSPQFYKQMAMASGFEKIFEIAPVFRANSSHTTRHDTEFTMIDMEISFINDVEDVMKTEEEWIVYFLTKLKENHNDQIKEFFNTEITIPTLPFPRVTMDEAIALVKEKGHECVDDLDAVGEKLLSEAIKEKYNHEFVFITNYPYSVRPFYHMKEGEDKTKSYDLVFKGVEITTGAQREHRYEVLKQQANEKGLTDQGIQDYLEFFSYGCPPHGGFAVSPTRILMLLLNIPNVREVTFLPRDTERLRP